MAVTYEPIATTTVSGSTTNSVTFSSIASTYTDLRVILSYGAVSSFYLGVRFNSDTGTNYSAVRMIANGSTATSSASANQSYIAVETNYSPTSTIPGLATIDVFSYAGSTFKTALNTGSSDLNGSGGLSRRVGTWRSTSAITSITVLDPTSSTNYFTSGSVITLYGIKKA